MTVFLHDRFYLMQIASDPDRNGRSPILVVRYWFTAQAEVVPWQAKP